MSSTAPARLQNLWDDAKAAGMSEPERLVYRSNILGSDKRVTNYGGGNTSSKIWQKDPLTGQDVEVLWVKGQKDDAQKLWRDAQTRDPQNDTLKSTLARLNVNL